MAGATVIVRTRPEQLQQALIDPRWFSDWAVGIRHVLGADADWPQPGARLEHTVGIGPLRRRDHTEVVRHDATGWTFDCPAWPASRVRVDLTITPSSHWMRVTMRRRPRSGPAAWAPRALIDPVLRARDDRALRRLRATVQRLRDEAGGPAARPTGARGPRPARTHGRGVGGERRARSTPGGRWLRPIA